jgi:hypothetical protein
VSVKTESVGDHFPCESTGRQIPMVNKCDKTFHCEDKTDEVNCTMNGRNFIITGTPLRFLDMRELEIFIQNLCSIGRSPRAINCVQNFRLFCHAVCSRIINIIVKNDIILRSVATLFVQIVLRIIKNEFQYISVYIS